VGDETGGGGVSTPTHAAAVGWGMRQAGRGIHPHSCCCCRVVDETGGGGVSTPTHAAAAGGTDG